MLQFSFSDIIGISGIVLAVVLIVLDKAGKLKGPWLFILLGVAALMTMCVAIGNAWVMDAPQGWRFWRGSLMFCLVALSYSAIGIWITPHPSSQSTPRKSAGVQLSITCDTVSLPMPFNGEIWILDTVMFSGLGKLSAAPKSPEGLWPEDGVRGIGYKCIVKNFGTQPAFGVSLSLDVTVLQWVRTGQASWGEGDPKQEHTVIVLIPQALGQQGNDNFSFYICSYDPDSSLSVRMPLVAWINSDDPKEKREVPVRIAHTLGNPLSVPPKMMLSPSHKKPRRP